MKPRIVQLIGFGIMMFATLSNGEQTSQKRAMPTELETQENAQLIRYRAREKNQILCRLSKEKKARYLEIGFAGNNPNLTAPLADRTHSNDDRGFIDWSMRIALDDQPTIDYLSSQEEGGFRIAHLDFLQSMSPNAIIYFAKWIFSDEPYGYVGPNDAPELAPSFRSCQAIAELLLEIDGIPEPVREWAKSFQRVEAEFFATRRAWALHNEAASMTRKMDDYFEKEMQDFFAARRVSMQRWWKANEKAFLEKRLSDVVPGEPQTTPQNALEFPSTETGSPTKESAASPTGNGLAITQTQKNGDRTRSNTTGPWLAFSALTTLIAVAFAISRRGNK